MPTELGNLGPAARAVIFGDVARGRGDVDGHRALVVHSLCLFSIVLIMFVVYCIIIPRRSGK